MVLKFRDFYRPSTKLREGNVLSHVYLSVSTEEEYHVTIIHDALDLTIEPSPPASCVQGSPSLAHPC